MAEFMRSSDAFSWSMERDPGLWSTIVTLVLLDRSPDWGQIVERFDRLRRTLPMFRQKVVPSPAPAPPRWDIDSDFDLGFHMRRVSAPQPGTVDTVLEMARCAAMETSIAHGRCGRPHCLVAGFDEGLALAN